MKVRHLISLSGALVFLAANPVQAGLTDLSDSPLANNNPSQAKPNVMLLMDTSGSMAWTHMPDGLEGVQAAGVKYIGYKSPQCNKLYYNREASYGLPKKADRTFQSSPAFTAAPYDIYDTANPATVDLTTSFKAYDGKTLAWGGDLTNPLFNDTAQAAYYYIYTGSQALVVGQAPCTDDDTGETKAARGGGTWTKVIVSSSSGVSGSDERQNFANWYTFYRTRLAMVKSAASLAFNALSDNFRVGFVTVQPKTDPGDTGINAAKYLPIADFNTTQRGLWFDKLFSQKPGGSSPAREGLARVGRHYAGKTDSINTNMTGDPVQFSCQQNFTIMTTDGYWNDQAETPSKGPVQIDGATRVGQQDGTLTSATGWTPRPIWEGFADAATVETNKTNTYIYESCGTGWFNKSTTQMLRSRSQNLQNTTQVLQASLNRFRSTSQELASMRQNLRSATQTIQTRTRITQTVTIPKQSTTQKLESTSRVVKNTSQRLKTTTQVRLSTLQKLTSTSQLQKTTTQYLQSTRQVRYYNASELWEPIASCPGGATCTTVTTTDVPVASCAGSVASAGNDYTATTCRTVINTAGAGSCTDESASSGNSYTATACNTVRTADVPSLNCATASANSGNAYTATTCRDVTTGPTLVASCSNQEANSGNNYTATTCSSSSNGPSAVASCTDAAASSANDYTATTCSNNNNTIPVASCSTDSATSANSWTSTTCPAAINTGPTPVASCTNSGPTSGNNYTTTTCSTNNTSNVPVTGCWPQWPNYWNGYTTTTCSTQTVSSGWVASCTPVSPTPGNGYQNTACSTATLSSEAVDVCTPAPPSAGNNYIGVACESKTTETPIGVCFPETRSAGNGWTTVTCPAPNVTTDVPTVGCTEYSASSGNAWVSRTCRTVTTGPTAVAACNASGANGTNNFVVTTCTQSTTPGVPVQSCATVAPIAGNGYTETTCTPNNTDKVAVESCVPTPASALNSWTATTCTPNNATDEPVASCMAAPASSTNAWTNTSCRPVLTGPTLTNSCSAAPASDSNSYVETVCDPVPGQKGRYRTMTTVTTNYYSGKILIPERSSVSTKNGSLTDIDGVCYATGTPAGEVPALPSPNPQPAWLDISPWPKSGPQPPSGCSGWPCSVGQTITGGSINSLADVAQYYYVNDLRPAADWPENIAKDNVKAVGTGPEDDRAKHQHMVTFTIALGVSGTLNYQSDYRSAATGDFADLRTGARNWPLWPDPAKATDTNKELWNDPKSIDDFWHTAVNGRGQYFSASTPSSVVSGLTGALSGIEALLAAGAAAGASSLEPVVGDNFMFTGRYTTKKWTGDIQARTIDVGTGAVGTTPVWSAQSKLDALTGAACDNRKIYLIRQGVTNNLVNFSWNSYACSGGEPTGSSVSGLDTTEQAAFDAVQTGLLSQYGMMTDGSNGTVDQRTPATGANLLNFIRGQRQFEGFEPGVAAKYYRTREHVLGDIVNGQPVYVKKPFADYADFGYNAFKTAYASRTPMLYAGANDGMLHAFNAKVFAADGTTADSDGGKEEWAVVPSTVLPNLYKLADNNYSNTHAFSVDGTPTVADIDALGPVASDTSPTDWKTILVGGLNKGGRGYYALDVTNPASPKALWEFKWGSTCWNGVASNTREDCHLGYTYGRPVVTKLENGQWVVLVTSGYNNVNSPAVAGDGVGYLYVLNANTGALMLKVATTAGSATTPSGLGQINNFVEDAGINNMTERVYAADLLGNVWRFQFGFTAGALISGSVVLIGTAKDSAGVAQPISTRPVLTEYKGETMVLFGTGKLLGVGDLNPALAANQQTQSVYGVKDPAPFTTTTPVHADLRAALAPLGMTQTGTGATARRKIACTGDATACGRTAGWVVDLPDTGERVNIDPRLAYGSLVFASNVPDADACSIGGYSWLNFINYRTGEALSRSDGSNVSEWSSTGLTVGLNIVYVGGKPIVITTGGGGDMSSKPLPEETPPLTGRRTSWREIVVEQ